MRQISLILLLIVASALAAHAVSPSGQFHQRLGELQRSGSCVELPRFGVSTHQGHNPDDVNVRLASEIGAGAVRFDIPWTLLEHEGRYDFAPFDRLIGGLRHSGKMIDLVLAYGHPDHSDGPANNVFALPPHTPEQLAAYGRYAQAVAKRYHGSDVAYEIWNEPNLDLFWPPRYDAQGYGRLLSIATGAIRAVDPTATILSAGLANENDPQKFLRTLATSGALDGVDGIAFHPYRQDAPENSLYDIAQFEKAAAGRAKRPLWLNEWGYSEVWLGKGGHDAQKVQAVMIARLMLTAALAKAKAAIVYDLIDDGHNPTDQESSFGLYDYQFQPKRAATAFRTIADLTSGCDTYEFTVDVSRAIIMAKFASRSITSYVIWTYRSGDGEDYCFAVGKSKNVALKDIFGDAVSWSTCRSSGIEMKLSDLAGPFILEIQ
jgi:polysaccharide biosynthesis protein PslG